jgi:hypothetical protein
MNANVSLATLQRASQMVAQYFPATAVIPTLGAARAHMHTPSHAPGRRAGEASYFTACR